VTDYAPLADRLASLAEADPDREVCGFVVADGSGCLSVVPVRNVAGEGRGPKGPGQDDREAFLVDPGAHLALARRLRVDGGQIAAVYHSHVGGPASLSRADIAGALDGDAPVLPGVDQIVIGTKSGKTQELKIFRWSPGGFRMVADLTDFLARRVARGAR
jgi:proteasome lid subunit RPN8/RPN11